MARTYIPNLDSTELAWEPGTIRHKRLEEGWAGKPALIDQRWFFKILSADAETGDETLLVRHLPGLRFQSPHFHEAAFEEFFFIEGLVRAWEDSPSVPSIYKPGYYTFRPPGWSHDVDVLEETMIVRVVQGHDSRIRTEAGAIGRNMVLPIERALEPRGYIRLLNSADLPWVGAFEFTSEHGWKVALRYATREKLWYRLLSKDSLNGATTALVRLDKGFLLPTSGRYTVTQEILVLSGELSVGAHRMRIGSYSFRPAGYVEGPIEALEDTVLFCRYGGAVERIEVDPALNDLNALGV